MFVCMYVCMYVFFFLELLSWAVWPVQAGLVPQEFRAFSIGLLQEPCGTAKRSQLLCQEGCPLRLCQLVGWVSWPVLTCRE